MANSLIKPIPLLKGMQPMNTEMVDGMAQQGTTQQTQMPQQPSVVGVQPKQAQPEYPPKTHQLFEGGPSAPQSQTVAPTQDDVGALQAGSQWAKTQLRDVWDIVSNIPTMVAQAWKSVIPDITDPLKGGEFHQALLDYMQYSKEDPEEASKIRNKFLKDMLTGSYQNENGQVTWGSFWKQAKGHSLMTALDALSLVGFGGSAAVKASKVARALGAGTTIAKDFKAAGIAGRLEMAGARLLDIESMPYRAVMSGLSKLEKIPPISWIEKGLKITPMVREAWGLRGTIAMHFAKQGQDELSKLMFARVPKARWDDLSDVMDLVKKPVRHEWDDATWISIQEWLHQNNQHVQWLKKSGLRDPSGLLMNEEWAKQAQIKKIVNRLRDSRLGVTKAYRAYRANGVTATIKSKIVGETDFFETPEGRELSKQYRAPHTEPELIEAELVRAENIAHAKAQGLQDADFFYRPWVEEGGTSLSEVIESLGDQADLSLKRRIPSLERLVGRPLLPTDPSLWASRAITARSLMKAEGTWTLEILRRYGKLIQSGDELPAGYMVMPGWFEKYLRQSDMALALWGRDQLPAIEKKMASKMVGGKIPQDVLIDTAESVAKILDDEENGFRSIFRDANRRVAVPEDIGGAMLMDMQRSNGFSNVWEKATNYWKSVLFMTPRFYFNNLVGNTILTIMHGVSPLTRSGYKVQNIPADVSRALISMADTLDPVKKMASRRVLRTIRDAKRTQLDIPQDALYRQAVFDRELKSALESRDRVLRLTESVGVERLAEMVRAQNGLDNVVLGARERMLVKGSEDLANLMLGPEAAEQYASLEIREAAVTKLRRRLEDIQLRKEWLTAKIQSANDDVVRAGVKQLEVQYGAVITSAEASLRRVSRLESRQAQMKFAIKAASAEDASYTITRLNRMLDKIELPLSGERARYAKLLEAGRDLRRQKGLVENAVQEFGSVGFADDDSRAFTLGMDLDVIDNDLGSGFFDAGDLKNLEAAMASKATSLPMELIPEASESVTGRLTNLRANFERREREVMAKLKQAEKAHEVIDDYAKKLVRGAAEEINSNELRKLAMPVEEAVQNMERFLGAYGKLTPFERKYIRRWINPFWTFQKTMFKLLWQMPLLRPRATAMLHRVVQLALESFDDDRLPASLKGYVVLGSTYSGKLIFGRVGSFNPFEAGGIREIARAPIPALLDPRLNPVVSIIHRAMGGYDAWDAPQPLRRGEEFMDAAGRVWRWDSDTGSAEMVTPSKNIMELVGEAAVPQWSMFNDLMASVGFQVPGPGPKLYKSPDGTIINPRAWWYAAGRSLGVPVESEELWRIDAREKRARYNKIKDVAKAVLRLKQREPVKHSGGWPFFNQPADHEQALKTLKDVLDSPEFETRR